MQTHGEHANSDGLQALGQLLLFKCGLYKIDMAVHIFLYTTVFSFGTEVYFVIFHFKKPPISFHLVSYMLNLEDRNQVLIL